jgi:hypothetical protein
MEKFKSNILFKIPELLLKGEDPDKEKREDLENQLKTIARGITYVEDLAGAQ